MNLHRLTISLLVPFQTSSSEGNGTDHQATKHYEGGSQWEQQEKHTQKEPQIQCKDSIKHSKNQSWRTRFFRQCKKTRKGMKRPEVGTRSDYLQCCGRQNLRGRKKRSRPEAPQKSNTPESNKKWRRSLGRGKARRRTRREEKGERNEEEDARLWMRSVSTSERAPARERTKPALLCWRRRERGTGDKSSGLNCRFTSWLRWRRPAALLTCCSRGGVGKKY